MWALYTEIERLEREADHSPTPTAQGKEGGVMCSLPHTPSRPSAYLIKYSNNFISFLPDKYIPFFCLRITAVPVTGMM
jgi:hypothetical protein